MLGRSSGRRRFSIARSWARLVATVGAARILTALGGAYLAIAVVLLVVDASSTVGPGRFVLLSVPGAVLAVGGARLDEQQLAPSTHPRLVAWVLGGLLVMLLVAATMHVTSPSGVDNPRFALPLATALGSTAGFLAGQHDARAASRRHELRETVEQLQRSNERLEQFARASSHDLQEPLRMVSSYLQLLDRHLGDDLDEDAREYLGFAVEGADRMRAMVESLLEYSTVSEGEGLEPVDADAVLEDVLADLADRLEATDATVTREELPTVLAAPGQLRQVFRNLLANALQYSGDDPPRIHVDAERRDDAWLFAVADEGVGVDPAYHDRIFEVFEQAHAGADATTRRAGGVGLALCERILERHGGDIWVESASGDGATFYFTLPAHDGAARAGHGGAERAGSRDGGTDGAAERVNTPS